MEGEGEVEKWVQVQVGTGERKGEMEGRVILWLSPKIGVINVHIIRWQATQLYLNTIQRVVISISPAISKLTFITMISVGACCVQFLSHTHTKIITTLQSNLRKECFCWLGLQI